jgi:hypothetical protein
LPVCDFRAWSGNLSPHATLAAGFHLKTKLRTSACHIAHTATAQVRHDHGIFGRRGVYDLAVSTSLTHFR